MVCVCAASLHPGTEAYALRSVSKRIGSFFSEENVVTYLEQINILVFSSECCMSFC